jgi:hypothetical protein
MGPHNSAQKPQRQASSFVAFCEYPGTTIFFFPDGVMQGHFFMIPEFRRRSCMAHVKVGKGGS